MIDINSILTELSNSNTRAFKELEFDRIGYLCLPGSIEGGNCTLIAINEETGPEFAIKVCREKNNSLFKREYDLLNAMILDDKYFETTVPQPYLTNTLNGYSFLVSKFINGKILLPRLNRQGIPKLKNAKQDFLLY